MKTMFATEDFQELLARLDSLTPGSPRHWGRMNAAQMLEHVARVLDMASGRTPTKQILLGRLLSWAVWPTFSGPKPFAKNAPTGPDFVVRETPDFVAAKALARTRLQEFHALGEQGCEGNVHAFFGPMSGRDWGTTQYKHVDHHLRQFGA